MTPPVLDPGGGPAAAPVAVVLRSLVEVLQAQGVPHAFTGAFALAYWAVPRNTKDIDVVILLHDEARRSQLLEALRAKGFDVPPGAREDLERGFHSTAVLADLSTGGRLVIELLVPKPGEEKLTARIVERARPMPFPGVEAGVRVVTAEDLVLYKLLLFRKGEGLLETDDLKDVEAIVGLHEGLDVGYVNLALSYLGLAPEELAKRTRFFEKALRRKRPEKGKAANGEKS